MVGTVQRGRVGGRERGREAGVGAGRGTGWPGVFWSSKRLECETMCATLQRQLCSILGPPSAESLGRTGHKLPPPLLFAAKLSSHGEELLAPILVYFS